jgi:hypothetical protein
MRSRVILSVVAAALATWCAAQTALTNNTKVAPRTYTITLGNLGPGDYGLLPPTGGDGTGTSGRLGKLYTFRVIE